MKLLITQALPLILFVHNSFGQSAREEQISFGNVLNKPIAVEVNRNNNRVEFVCINKSYHPYKVELEFQDLSNLRPSTHNITQVVTQGRYRLVTFTIIDQEKPHNYSYTVKYSRGIESEKANEDFVYLIPLKEGKKVSLTRLWNNQFHVDPFDTIYAARKGTVIALPDNKYDTDRITKNSLEIMHEDGTIAIYVYLHPDKVFVKLGQKVIPGQSLGQVKDQPFFKLTIYKSVGSGRLQSIRPNFFTGESESNHLVEQEGVTIMHPVKLIVQELTKRELNRYIKKEKAE